MSQCSAEHIVSEYPDEVTLVCDLDSAHRDTPNIMHWDKANGVHWFRTEDIPGELQPTIGS